MRFNNWKRPTFNKQCLTKWNWMCQHYENLTLGIGCDIGAFSYLNAKYGIEIGENAQIASHVSIYSVSTIDNKQGKVKIGRNARIGSHSVIMPGVTIGENSVIGSFSFVAHDVPPNVQVYGIPVSDVEKWLKACCVEARN